MQILRRFILLLKRLQTIADEQKETNHCSKCLRPHQPSTHAKDRPFAVGDVIKNEKAKSPYFSNWRITRIDAGWAYGHSDDSYQIPCQIEEKYWSDYTIKTTTVNKTDTHQDKTTRTS
jgi:hypothetical protein